MTTNKPAHYTTEFSVDDDGWWVVSCSCGWNVNGSGFPAADDAADAYGDHMYSAALAENEVPA